MVITLTFTTKTLDLTVRPDLVILKNGHLDLLSLVLDLLGSGLKQLISVPSATSPLPPECTHVVLLLPLLGHTTTKTENKMEGRFLLDVVIRKSSTVLELFTRKDQSLLVWWNTLLVLDFGFDIVDSVRRLDFECDRLAREAGFVSESSGRVHVSCPSFDGRDS